jgi:hypothetical protein
MDAVRTLSFGHTKSVLYHRRLENGEFQLINYIDIITHRIAPMRLVGWSSRPCRKLSTTSCFR